MVQVQYSPESGISQHKGQYYKFTFADGTDLKIIDPNTYVVSGWPERGGKTKFQDPSGKMIAYNPASRTRR